MCYICSCFTWGIDLLQRVITFGLVCLLCGAVCIGLSVAVIAGVAYGYNYSMAEFITFAHSDVTVFMRRGQLGDKPDSSPTFRRHDGDDMFSSNATIDYEDQRPPADSKPLADTWLKTQDTRKYAEILTRYSPIKRAGEQESAAQEAAELPLARPEPARPRPELSRQQPEPPVGVEEQKQEVHQYITPESPIISIVPNPLIPTVSWRSGSSEIMMRNFKPMLDYTTISRVTSLPENLFATREPGPQSIAVLSPKEKAKGPADAKLRDDFHKSYVPMRVWGTTTHKIIRDESTEEVDEDNIVYKPV